MKLLKQLRGKMRAIRKRPEIYVRHYALAFVLRGTLLFLEVVLLRLFYVPLRFADLSTREIVQYIRKIDFNIGSWFKSALGKCLEVRSWLQGLGNFASLPEALRHLNTRLYAWLQWKREAILSFYRMLREPRKLGKRVRDFVRRHFRNRRMVRRGAVRMVLGIILAKFLTVLYVAFAGAAIFSVWGFDCLFMILGFLQIAATRLAHFLGRVIEHHIFLVQQGADFAGEEKKMLGRQGD